ncbi:MAG: hypothetical protein OK452_07575, partial [Thaumarchaeota archaeon]|nr:hypothetical protein [Nitrososphaerota archaeon]
GNNLPTWIEVPIRISSFADIEKVIEQTKPLEVAYVLGSTFGLTRDQIEQGRCEWFAYLLGFMLGDASKGKSAQDRFRSMNIDLQLTKKWPTNERTGDFVAMAANSLGFQMGRIRDKPPTGYTKISRNPTAAFRWTSERSPFFAWMFTVGLGLSDNQTTSLDRVKMDWIFETPHSFRRRFVQGVADSDGCVKKYLVEITSLPNSNFTTSLLHSLGLRSAYTRLEKGIPLRTVVRAREAVNLPIFNEFVRSYRYEKLLVYKRDEC